MSLESLQNYLDTRLVQDLGAAQYIRLVSIVFTLVFASAIVIDLLLRPATRVPHLLIHAGSIGLIYVTGVTIAAALFLLGGTRARGLRVWHLWAISLAGFTIGYFLVPWDAVLTFLPGLAAARHAEPLGFNQLLPISLVITYVFIQPYYNSSLKKELGRLRTLNELLASKPVEKDARPRKPIEFEAGRTRFRLPADAIVNITVDDHYCYVFANENGKETKRAIAVTLRDLMNELPDDFIQVHRSHVVNLKHVRSIRRIGRNIRVILTGDREVPVSRHRLEEVLPALCSELGHPWGVKYGIS